MTLLKSIISKIMPAAEARGNGNTSALKHCKAPKPSRVFLERSRRMDALISNPGTPRTTRYRILYLASVDGGEPKWYEGVKIESISTQVGPGGRRGVTFVVSPIMAGRRIEITSASIVDEFGDEVHASECSLSAWPGDEFRVNRTLWIEES